MKEHALQTTRTTTPGLTGGGGSVGVLMPSPWTFRRTCAHTASILNPATAPRLGSGTRESSPSQRAPFPGGAVQQTRAWHLHVKVGGPGKGGPRRCCRGAWGRGPQSNHHTLPIVGAEEMGCPLAGTRSREAGLTVGSVGVWRLVGWGCWKGGLRGLEDVLCPGEGGLPTTSKLVSGKRRRC